MYSATYIWAKTLGYLEAQCSDETVCAWFDDAELIELTDTQLVIFVPSDRKREIILQKYKTQIEQYLQTQFDLQVQLCAWNETELPLHRQTKARNSLPNVGARFTFENFLPGTSNELPLKAAMQVASNPGDRVYNPLFLYGAPGVGKTHLLYAIANEVSRNHPDAKIITVTGEQFIHDLILAIRTSTSEEYRKRYREADYLLVDDIQFIAGKEVTQEEFFHTLDALYKQNKQIVLTSDRKPGDLATLSKRLKARFGVGVMVEIAAPDLETRKQIIRAKAKELALQLDAEAVDSLANQLCDNVCRIEGGLHKLHAAQDLTHTELTPENISRLISDI